MDVFVPASSTSEENFGISSPFRGIATTQVTFSGGIFSMKPVLDLLDLPLITDHHERGVTNQISSAVLEQNKYNLQQKRIGCFALWITT